MPTKPKVPSFSKSWESIGIPKEVLLRVMTNMVVFPAVRVNNLNDKDVLSTKVLTCFVNALSQTGVAITDENMNVSDEETEVLLMYIPEIITEGNEEAEAHERFERGIKWVKESI